MPGRRNYNSPYSSRFLDKVKGGRGGWGGKKRVTSAAEGVLPGTPGRHQAPKGSKEKKGWVLRSKSSPLGERKVFFGRGEKKKEKKKGKRSGQEAFFIRKGFLSTRNLKGAAGREKDRKKKKKKGGERQEMRGEIFPSYANRRPERKKKVQEEKRRKRRMGEIGLKEGVTSRSRRAPQADKKGEGRPRTGGIFLLASARGLGKRDQVRSARPENPEGGGRNSRPTKVFR